VASDSTSAVAGTIPLISSTTALIVFSLTPKPDKTLTIFCKSAAPSCPACLNAVYISAKILFKASISVLDSAVPEINLL